MRLAQRVVARWPTAEQVVAAGPDALTEVPGVGAKVARSILQQATTLLAHNSGSGAVAHDEEFANELASLAGVSRNAAEVAARRYLDAAALAAASPVDLTVLNGIGPRAAREMIAHAQDELERRLVTEALGSEHPFDLLDGQSPTVVLQNEMRDVDDDAEVDAEDGPCPAWRDGLVVVWCVVCGRPELDVPGRVETIVCRRCDSGHVARGPHGLKAALHRRCRCGVCLAELADKRSWLDQRVRGATLQDLADANGLTRERVRQILAVFDVAGEHEAVQRVRRAAQAEIEQVAANAVAVARSESLGPCPTCGGQVPGSRKRRFCSTDCRERFDTVRFHVDPHRRETHRLAMARWVLENPERVQNIHLRHARRVLDGTATEVDERRWLIEGSEPFKVSVEAYVNGWPLADLLPEPIIEQIETHLGIRTTDWEAVLTAEVLEHEYHVLKQTPSAIAGKYGCDLEAVHSALDRHEVERRRSLPVFESPFAAVLTRDFLEREYLVRGRSGPDIARQVGCNPTAVYAALRRHDLPVRNARPRPQ